MRRIFLAVIPMAVLLLGLVPIASAADPFTAEETLDPLQITSYPIIPTGSEGSVDIIIESDRPINIYIISSLEVYSTVAMMDAHELLNYTGADETYIEVTYKEVNKDYDYEDAYYIVILNPSTEESTDITVEYEYWEDIIEDEVEEAAKDALCGGAIGLGILALAGFLATAIIILRR
ncbi:MAG: hypothetical protein ACMUIE_08140 [Thermoplasmatota archaeon]